MLEEPDGEHADAIGLSGQMHGLVALGTTIGRCAPRSSGTTGECELIEKRVGLARLLELSGNRALAGFTERKLVWMAEHEPDLYARIRPRASAA